MSDQHEIIQRSECFVIYRSSDWGPPIPYPAVDRPDTPDRPNRGFIDLRDDTDAASKVYEAQDVPGLRALISAVNRPGSELMSLGCERKLNQLDPPRGDANCYLNSYLEITYRDPNRHSEAEMLQIAQQIEAESGLEIRNWVQVELGIERMKGFFGLNDGSCLYISVSGFGRNSEEASATHEFGCKSIARVLSEGPRQPKD